MPWNGANRFYFFCQEMRMEIQMRNIRIHICCVNRAILLFEILFQEVLRSPRRERGKSILMPLIFA
ncbi:hypothetical protein TA05_17850 [Citrobacter rodentium]|nr:hypothetical protein TA05_17850 [Citrobacter rodentium]